MRCVSREVDALFNPFNLPDALASGDEQRFQFYYDEGKKTITHLRAMQGHSRYGVTQQTMGHKPLSYDQIPVYAYHGTKHCCVESIALQGIIPGGLAKGNTRPEAYYTSVSPWQNKQALIESRATGYRFHSEVAFTVRLQAFALAGAQVFKIDSGALLTQQTLTP